MKLILSLCAVFCILSTALAGDVGVDSIICPRGTVDSGQTVVPRLIVANYGSEPESLMVMMVIDQSGVEQYRDSLVLASLPPGATDTVALWPWVPAGRDSMTATAWTECVGDTFPLNDTARARFRVRVTDVAVTDIIAPVDTLDSGIVVYPEAIVWNYGNVLDTLLVRFEIGAYVSICTLYGSGHAVAPDPYYTTPGIYVHRVTALYPDQHPENNTMVDTFWVRGTSRHDVGVLRIVAPVGTIYAGTGVTPTARLGNFGVCPETFWVWFDIWDSAGACVYGCESMQVMIGAYDSLDVEFTPDWVVPLGFSVVRCSVSLIGDSDSLNDVLRDTCWGIQRPGVEESHKPQAASSKLTASVVRGVLRIGDRTQNTGHRGELLDASGRKVMDLWPGANDVRHLAAGVYFVRQGQGGHNRNCVPVPVHKVVLQK